MQGRALPEPTWPDKEDPRVVALAGRDPEGRTVSLILDPATANVTMFAVSAYAGNREAHVREVEQAGEKLPENSYGRRNRQAIAAREARVAARLRAVERAYGTAIEHDAAVMPDPARPLTSSTTWPTTRWNSSEWGVQSKNSSLAWWGNTYGFAP